MLQNLTISIDARASNTIESSYFMVPYEKNEYFLGRDDFLNLIFDKLSDIKPHQYCHRIALYGMGGVRKTQTALAYAYIKTGYYNSVFWVSGATQAELLSGFQRIASKTSCAIGASDSTEVTERVLKWLQRRMK